MKKDLRPNAFPLWKTYQQLWKTPEMIVEKGVRSVQKIKSTYVLWETDAIFHTFSTPF